MGEMAPTGTSRLDRWPDPQLVGVGLLLVLVLPNPANYGPMGQGADIQATVVAFGYTIMAVLALVAVLEAAWGRTAALIGGAALVATAAFARGLMQSHPGTAEAAWVIAAAWAGQRAIGGDRWPGCWALAAGMFLSLALQVRFSSVALLPIIVVGFAAIADKHSRLALLALCGLVLSAVYALLTDRAGLRSSLAELADRLRPLFFNVSLIDSWMPTACIPAHWTVRGVVNLLFNPQIGPVLLAAAMLLVLARKHLAWKSPEVLMAGAALLYAITAIYGLATDPRPQNLLPVVAIAAAMVGRLGAMAWEEGEHVLVGTMLIGFVAVGAFELQSRRSGGTAAPLSTATASASAITRCPSSPRVRIATVRSSASRRPRTSRYGTLASECSRTL